MFVRTLPAVEQGALIDIRLNVDSNQVLATGKVCWTNSGLESDPRNLTMPPGIGIQFVEFKEGEDALNNYIRKPSIIPKLESDKD